MIYRFFTYCLYAFITIWMLPVSIPIWLFYIFPLWITHHIRLVKHITPILFQFEVVEKKNCLYSRWWRDWWGCSIPHCIILRWDVPIKYREEVIMHENCHEQRQWEVYGIFQPVLYFSFTIFIWLFLKNKHSYLDNPFERQARKAAGEPVDIPRDKWPQGPNDRFPWW
jgi:hypothetical protein